MKKQEKCEIEIVNNDVLVVSCQECCDKLQLFREKYKENHKKATFIVYLHFGVAAVRKELCIESTAVNKTLSSPDVTNYIPDNPGGPIEKDMG